uniref:Isoform 3 of Nuclear cap-binding protein subunit 3 n=1 Tax=Mus musculus TaxID=10090 RepID=Q8BZR9-3|nr:unnamed protein product [Mus musculus]
MAAVRGLRVSVKAEAPAGPALGLPSPEVESGLERGEPEPMEVEEGELEIVPVRRSLKELLPDTSRRYENKAGSFITGIDVTSKEAIEKKEQRAKRFHFRAEVNLAQRNVALDRDMMKKGTVCLGEIFHPGSRVTFPAVVSRSFWLCPVCPVVIQIPKRKGF